MNSTTTSTTSSVVNDHAPDKHAVDARDASESATSNEASLNPKNVVLASSTTVVFEATTLTGAAVYGTDSAPPNGPAATASKADHDVVDPSASSAKYEGNETEGDIIDNLIAMGWDPRGRPDRPSKPFAPPTLPPRPPQPRPVN